MVDSGAAGWDSRVYSNRVRTVKTPWGPADYVRVRRIDLFPMSWTEISAALQDDFPGRWALQWFPPAGRVIDTANVYHVLVLPAGVRPYTMDIYDEQIGDP